MAQYYYEETQQLNTASDVCSVYDVEQTDVMTGDVNKRRYLYYQLKMSIMKAKQIDIVVSFLMESGVRMLLKDLGQALDRGVKIRLLTGNYLGITQPSALYLIKNELGDRVDLRFYNERNRSFHPKAYIFHGQQESEIYIGSSNISKSALTSGIEWNYRFSKQTDKSNFALFLQTFNDLFTNHSIKIDEETLKEYSRNWKKPAVSKDLERYDEYKLEDTKVEYIFQPRGVQIEALYALKNSREEGADKGLVYAATGIGKTYLAAFDSASYERVLFVAHREEILLQAAESFKNVRRSDDYGFFSAKNKDTEKSVIFASVASIGKTMYLNHKYFAEDYFDYIIIDEFHHAVNDGYKRIMGYFKPKFMLGLTATPERMDGRNIYELCNYIVPYQISLKDAINKGVLVPFHYYGIYDETIDYTRIHLVKGKYDENELTEKLLVQARYELIYKHYMKYRSKCALGFCRSRIHAETMAKEFRLRGIPAVAVYSGINGEYSEDRKSALDKLKCGEIKVIFSVDMFNEGLDIPEVDMVMFLRPTESPVVFLQQTGRGLRRCKNKEYLNVLDFIGNYKKAGNAPFLLSEQPYSREKAVKSNQQDFDFPDECLVDFDLRLIDLFKEMAKQNQTRKEYIREEYFRVKEQLEGKVPTRMELFTYMEDELYELCINNASENPFRNYLNYLHELNQLSSDEEEIYAGIGREFLNTIETTSMTKSYKMPVLNAFYNHGEIKQGITDEDIYQSLKQFYNCGINGNDLMNANGTKDYKNWDKKKYVAKAKDQPIKFLKKSGNGFFVDKEGYILALNDQLSHVIDNKVFINQMKDIIDYRTMEYYRKRYRENECR